QIVLRLLATCDRRLGRGHLRDCRYGHCRDRHCRGRHRRGRQDRRWRLGLVCLVGLLFFCVRRELDRWFFFGFGGRPLGRLFVFFAFSCFSTLAVFLASAFLSLFFSTAASGPGNGIGAA